MNGPERGGKNTAHWIATSLMFADSLAKPSWTLAVPFELTFANHSFYYYYCFCNTLKQLIHRIRGIMSSKQGHWMVGWPGGPQVLNWLYRIHTGRARIQKPWHSTSFHLPNWIEIKLFSLVFEGNQKKSVFVTFQKWCSSPEERIQINWMNGYGPAKLANQR